MNPRSGSSYPAPTYPEIIVSSRGHPDPAPESRRMPEFACDQQSRSGISSPPDKSSAKTSPSCLAVNAVFVSLTILCRAHLGPSSPPTRAVALAQVGKSAQAHVSLCGL